MAVFDELTLTFIELLAFFLGVTGCVLIKIDHKVPKAYMDEIFHVPQAQNYCDGRFLDWDPMITTLPGLYLTSTGVAKSMTWLTSVSMKITCSIFWLRSLNVIFALANFFLLFMLLKRLHRGSENYDPGRALMNAVTLSIFPVLYFFSFLYYTDPGSTFFVLLMYLLCLYRRHTLSALAGCFSVIFRQTNIVWVVFAAGLVVTEQIMEFVRPDKKDIKPEVVQGLSFLPIIVKQLFVDVKATGWLLGRILLNTWAYIVVGISFVVFIIVNGSIVVGAKNDHQAGLHFPQLLYFLAFTAVMSFIHFFSIAKIKGFFKYLYQRPIMVIVFCALSVLFVWKFTFAHRYLLSDNRHYTFYVWAKIFRRHALVKYALIPGYLAAFYCVSDELKRLSILWKLVFVLCVVVNLVPSMLLEFRYFIIPYLIFRLNMKIPSYLKLTIELLFYAIINGATLYTFAFNTFEWPNESGLQRFMW